MDNNAVTMYRSAEVVPGIRKQCPPKISHVIHSSGRDLWDHVLCVQLPLFSLPQIIFASVSSKFLIEERKYEKEWYFPSFVRTADNEEGGESRSSSLSFKKSVCTQLLNTRQAIREEVLCTINLWRRHLSGNTVKKWKIHRKPALVASQNYSWKKLTTWGGGAVIM